MMLAWFPYANGGPSLYYPGLIAFLISSALQSVTLWHWRSRPWMPTISAMLVIIAVNITEMIPHDGKRWGWLILLSFLYVVPLLYGTRLLALKEREDASTARKPAQ